MPNDNHLVYTDPGDKRTPKRHLLSSADRQGLVQRLCAICWSTLCGAGPKTPDALKPEAVDQCAGLFTSLDHVKELFRIACFYRMPLAQLHGIALRAGIQGPTPPPPARGCEAYARFYGVEARQTLTVKLLLTRLNRCVRFNMSMTYLLLQPATGDKLEKTLSGNILELSTCGYLDLQSIKNNSLWTHNFGTKAVLLGTLEVHVKTKIKVLGTLQETVNNAFVNAFMDFHRVHVQARSQCMTSVVPDAYEVINKECNHKKSDSHIQDTKIEQNSGRSNFAFFAILCKLQLPFKIPADKSPTIWGLYSGP